MIKMPATIRARLTWWYAIDMALILAIFSIGTYLFVRESLFSQIDTRLEENMVLVVGNARTDLHELSEVERHTPALAFRVLEDGWPIYVSNGWHAADLDAVGKSPENGRWIFSSPRGNIYHLKEQSIVLSNQNLRFATAEQSEQIHLSLDRLGLVLLLGFPLALLLCVFGGYIFAGRILKPIKLITERARSIRTDNLSERLIVANPNDELGQLSMLLNEAFANLDESFNRLHHFTQDAAHELRTPLAVLRGVGEVGLQDQREAPEYREVISSMLEEVDRMGRLVDGLLTLARGESGRFSASRVPHDLLALTHEVVECLRVLAEEKQQYLTFTAEKILIAEIDSDTMRLALMNLIANAIRYTPAGGMISVSLLAGVASFVIEVQDNGPGISSEHHAHIFERFYRVDSSRSNHTGGTGLGLAITRWAVEANKGHIELISTLGQGCLFRIEIPK